ncbi:MAG: hypothetical protein EOP10_22550 [Proteobacteria bacterium]|nr:MAG: hypothetical protein EOP10_22550 [Pseudomonadota bacterium]
MKNFGKFGLASVILVGMGIFLSIRSKNSESTVADDSEVVKRSTGRSAAAEADASDDDSKPSSLALAARPSNVVSRVPPPQERPVSLQEKFISEALAKPAKEIQRWQDPTSHHWVKATLVEDKAGEYPFILIKQYYEDQAESVFIRSAAQLGNELLVQFSKDLSEEELQSFLKELDVTSTKEMLLPRTAALEFSDVSIQRIRELEETLKSKAEIRFVDPNTIAFALATVMMNSSQSISGVYPIPV